MWWMTIILTVLRVFDALNDPVMGMVVDNSMSRFGKFKPMMMIGAIAGAAFMVPMFVDFWAGADGVFNPVCRAVFGVGFVLWRQ